MWHLSFNSDDGPYCFLSFFNSLVSSSTFLLFQTGWNRPLLTSQFSPAVSDEFLSGAVKPYVTPSFISDIGYVHGINIWPLINPHTQQGRKSYNCKNTQERRFFYEHYLLKIRCNARGDTLRTLQMHYTQILIVNNLFCISWHNCESYSASKNA